MYRYIKNTWILWDGVSRCVAKTQRSRSFTTCQQMLRKLPPVLLLATNASESLARKAAESISQGAEIMEEPRAQSSDQFNKRFLGLLVCFGGSNTLLRRCYWVIWVVVSNIFYLRFSAQAACQGQPCHSKGLGD